MVVYDFIIIGLGAVGSSAMQFLAKSGHKVAGFDLGRPPHGLGSSHGESRIIRQAYYESPKYVPLVKQSMEYWSLLEEKTGESLFVKCGSLMLGEEDTDVIRGALNSAAAFAIKHEKLSSVTLRQHFPALRPELKTVGVLEYDAGLLIPENCIRANLKLADEAGACIFYDEKVLEIKSGEDFVEILTDRGKYQCRKMIVTAGPWVGKLLKDLALPLEVERRTVHWFIPLERKEEVNPVNLPVYIWKYDDDKMFYGFPDIGSGIKIASTRKGKESDPDLLDRHISEEELDEAKQIVERFFDIKMSYKSSSVCMYTNTPDEDFIIDFHPVDKRIVIGSPCSGHGFKFAILMGKVLAEMASEESLSVDIRDFRISRFNDLK